MMVLHREAAQFSTWRTQIEAEYIGGIAMNEINWDEFAEKFSTL
jgi:hypothetical protein